MDDQGIFLTTLTRNLYSMNGAWYFPEEVTCVCDTTKMPTLTFKVVVLCLPSSYFCGACVGTQKAKRDEKKSDEQTKTGQNNLDPSVMWGKTCPK
jgi:hypothetical protein